MAGDDSRAPFISVSKGTGQGRYRRLAWKNPLKRQFLYQGEKMYRLERQQ